jgi:[NiFe] hydrogenase assembly HybE family chaperone
MICPEYVAAGLETEFTRIQRERMADVPILNPSLKVQAVGFTAWEGYCLGILITPWFMNLMLLSQKGDEWTHLPSGTRINHRFPSGTCEFILGEGERIGRYLMCSLFSPVFEFQNQEAAVVTAEAVLENLMDEANRDDSSGRESGIRKVWHGKDEREENSASGEKGDRAGLSERLEKPVSRRDLLRRAFVAGKE